MVKLVFDIFEYLINNWVIQEGQISCQKGQKIASDSRNNYEKLEHRIALFFYMVLTVVISVFLPSNKWPFSGIPWLSNNIRMDNIEFLSGNSSVTLRYKKSVIKKSYKKVIARENIVFVRNFLYYNSLVSSCAFLNPI